MKFTFIEVIYNDDSDIVGMSSPANNLNKAIDIAAREAAYNLSQLTSKRRELINQKEIIINKLSTLLDYLKNVSDKKTNKELYKFKRNEYNEIRNELNELNRKLNKNKIEFDNAYKLVLFYRELVKSNIENNQQ